MTPTGSWPGVGARVGQLGTALVEVANVGASGSLWVIQFLVLDRVLSAPSSGSQRIPAGG